MCISNVSTSLTLLVTLFGHLCCHWTIVTNTITIATIVMEDCVMRAFDSKHVDLLLDFIIFI
jgi:hypothetical protein